MTPDRQPVTVAVLAELEAASVGGSLLPGAELPDLRPHHRTGCVPGRCRCTARLAVDATLVAAAELSHTAASQPPTAPLQRRYRTMQEVLATGSTLAGRCDAAWWPFLAGRLDVAVERWRAGQSASTDHRWRLLAAASLLTDDPPSELLTAVTGLPLGPGRRADTVERLLRERAGQLRGSGRGGKVLVSVRTSGRPHPAVGMAGLAAGRELAAASIVALAGLPAGLVELTGHPDVVDGDDLPADALATAGTLVGGDNATPLTEAVETARLLHATG